MKKSIYLFLLVTGQIFNAIPILAQPWAVTLNNITPPFFINNFGTSNNFSVDIFTNNTQKAQFTVSTGIPAGLFGNQNYPCLSLVIF